MQRHILYFVLAGCLIGCHQKTHHDKPFAFGSDTIRIVNVFDQTGLNVGSAEIRVHSTPVNQDDITLYPFSLHFNWIKSGQEMNLDDVFIGAHNGIAYIGKPDKSLFGLSEEIVVDTLIDFDKDQQRDLWKIGIWYSRWERFSSNSGVLVISKGDAIPPTKLKMIIEEGAIKRLVVEDELPGHPKFFRFAE